MAVSTAGSSSISRSASARTGSSSWFAAAPGQRSGMRALSTRWRPACCRSRSARRPRRRPTRWPDANAIAFASAGVSRAPPTTARARSSANVRRGRAARRSRRSFPRFIGTIQQLPPAYSAIKVNGRRAYALARTGTPPVLTPRPVEIAELRLIGDARSRPCRLRGAGRQGNLHPRPRPRSRRSARHLRPYCRTAPPFGRAFHRKPGDRTGFHRRAWAYFRRIASICFRSRPRWTTSRRWSCRKRKLPDCAAGRG